jgi:hypothetical protein
VAAAAVAAVAVVMKVVECINSPATKAYFIINLAMDLAQV